MNFENYDGTAIDPSTFGQLETEPTPVDEPIVDTPTDESATPEPVKAEPPVQKENVTYEIEGVGTFTADQIKELQQGNLRQSDYTKKTQDLARQREEAKDALELFNYLRNNPHLLEAMKQAERNPQNTPAFVPTQENEMLKQVLFNQKALETDMKMNALKAKYADVDEIAIYNKAAELKTDDFEFVYKALNYDNNKIDQQAIIDAAKAQLLAELEANKNTVTTIVDTKQSASIQKPTTLSAAEKRVAAAMGISEADYAKWR